MKISDIYQKASIVRDAGTAMPQKNEVREDGAAALQGKDGSGASVDLSSRSVELSKVAESLDRDAVERAEKVNQIRAKILSGTYNIETSRVADKIIREAILDLPKT